MSNTSRNPRDSAIGAYMEGHSLLQGIENLYERYGPYYGTLNPRFLPSDLSMSERIEVRADAAESGIISLRICVNCICCNLCILYVLIICIVVYLCYYK